MNPHPRASCPWCGATKPCVAHLACSELYADNLRFTQWGQKRILEYRQEVKEKEAAAKQLARN